LALEWAPQPGWLRRQQCPSVRTVGVMMNMVVPLALILRQFP
jgi:hypothetical protein